MFMIRISAITFCLFFVAGCQPVAKYTTQQDYIEERKWDKEKGLVKNYEASWSVQWEE